MILVAGGEQDPNVLALKNRLDAVGCPHMTVLVGASHHPCVTWDMTADDLMVDGESIRPRSVFIRHDVFSSLANGREESSFRAYAWYATIMGWALAHDDVRLFNRGGADRMVNKLHALRLATQHGLHVPATITTNDLNTLDDLVRDGQSLIAKPVAGGTYCQELSLLLRATERREGSAAAPAIVQHELVPPELRIFRIANRYLAFNVEADALDYRTASECKLVPVNPPTELVAGLEAVMDYLQLDFGAADFKTCPETGRVLFLEINNAPMFAAFDRVCNGKLCELIIEYLSP